MIWNVWFNLLQLLISPHIWQPFMTVQKTTMPEQVPSFIFDWHVSVVDIHFWKFLWIYCTGHASMKRNDWANGVVGKAAITCSLCLRGSDMLRSLRHYLCAQSQGQHISDHQEERGMEEEALSDLPWKDKRRAPSMRWTLEQFKDFIGKTSERQDGVFLYGFFWACRYHLELNWIELNWVFDSVLYLCVEGQQWFLYLCVEGQQWFLYLCVPGQQWFLYLCVPGQQWFLYLCVPGQQWFLYLCVPGQLWFLYLCVPGQKWFLYLCVPGQKWFLYLCVPGQKWFLYLCVPGQQWFLYLCVPGQQRFLYLCVPGQQWYQDRQKQEQQKAAEAKAKTATPAAAPAATKPGAPAAGRGGAAAGRGTTPAPAARGRGAAAPPARGGKWFAFTNTEHRLWLNGVGKKCRAIAFLALNLTAISGWVIL